MAAFLSSLQVLDDGDGRHMQLLDPLVFETDHPRPGCLRWFTVPVGFTTDFASIPRPLWACLDPHGRYDRAAVLHDYLYQYAPNGLSRTDADGYLREAMRASGVPRWQVFVIYAGVRIGGGLPWRRCRAAQAA